MNIGKDKLSVSGENLNISWSFDMKEITFMYNNNKKDPQENISVIATCKDFAKGYKIGDGKNHIAGGTAMHSFYPNGKVEATISFNGLKEPVIDSGLGLFIRACSTGILPFNIGEDWLLSVVTNNPAQENQDEYLFHLMHYTTPQKYGGQDITQGAIIRKDKPAIYFYNNTAEYLDMTSGISKHYEIPSSVKITCHGMTSDGKKASLNFLAKPEIFANEIDVLGQLNKLIKSFVQALVTKPYIFQFHQNNAKLTLQVEGEDEVVLAGDGFLELTMMK
ncbi:Survival factor 1 [Smittium culicis]|uniref:Survival factor 1 n=1 Tax=Smittium culicis TaxID=133412 RepID=A0A1R1YSB0_9FUNG|nr:Survival factor 1 [Smittium culicis]